MDTMLATETWEWVFLGMPWRIAAVIALIGVVAVMLMGRGGDR